MEEVNDWKMNGDVMMMIRDDDDDDNNRHNRHETF